MFRCTHSCTKSPSFPPVRRDQTPRGGIQLQHTQGPSSELRPAHGLRAVLPPLMPAGLSHAVEKTVGRGKAPPWQRTQASKLASRALVVLSLCGGETRVKRGDPSCEPVCHVLWLKGAAWSRAAGAGKKGKRGTLGRIPPSSGTSSAQPPVAAPGREASAGRGATATTTTQD